MQQGRNESRESGMGGGKEKGREGGAEGERGFVYSLLSVCVVHACYSTHTCTVPACGTRCYTHAASAT